LKSFALGGRSDRKSNLAGIIPPPNPPGFHGKLKLIDFSGAFRKNNDLVRRIRLNIQKYGTFNAAPGDAQILKQGLPLKHIGKPYPGMAGISDAFPFIQHIQYILYDERLFVNQKNLKP
jgi:hypothetical protein